MADEDAMGMSPEENGESEQEVPEPPIGENEQVVAPAPPPPPPLAPEAPVAYAPPPPPPGAPEAIPVIDRPHKEKLVAGLLGILLGGLGVHKFYLGYQQEGIILLVVTIAGAVLSCVAIGWFFLWVPSVIGLVEGIIYLTKTDEEFERIYVVGRKPWL